MITAEPMPIERPATLDDLMRVEGKAELIDGRIVSIMPTGHLPGDFAFNIARLLYEYRKLNGGVVHADGVAYIVPELKSRRKSFSPDASYFKGKLPNNRMRFIEGAPTFAVEVRSENDYGVQAEYDIAQKRADYFEAGTLVVWDVDSNEKCVNCYRKSSPFEKLTFRLGQMAHAEPALPGWQVSVDSVFEEQN